MTGQLPYPGKNPRELFQQLLSKPPTQLNQASKSLKFTPEVEAAVMRGLERDLAKRWKTVAEFAAGFCQAAGEVSDKARNGGGFLSSLFRRRKE